MKNILAIDLGASSGRAILGRFDGSRINMEEIHRFPNEPVTVNGTMYWDTLRLYHEIKQSLIKAKQAGGILSLSVDTWGVDFGLVASSGHLIGNPVHYRDNRTSNISKKVFKIVGPEELYEITGNQIMEINTLFQLMAVKEQDNWMLETADKMLLTPDLFHYFLTGKMAAELSIASTTQLMDAKRKAWSQELITKLGLPSDILPEIVPSGTILGGLKEELCEEFGIAPCKVIAGCGHDTQCAMAATPADEKDFIFLSCGTWSLLGTELEEPIITEMSKQKNVTNEAGFAGRTSFLKNIIGLWLIQESRRQWIREGQEYSFGELDKMAEQSEAFACFVDPDAPVFTPSGDIPERIREYCIKTGQHVPETNGAIVRCINESLAMKYRASLDEIKACTGKEYPAIHIVGGGTKSKLLCQMTANATNMLVTSGPVEASVLGNMAIQLIAQGEIADLIEARKIIRNSEEIKTYQPQQSEQWEKEYLRYLTVTGI